MDNIKSPRFILAAFALIAILVLAILGKIDGSTAVGTILGLAVGSGVVFKATKRTGINCLVLLSIGLLVCGIGCAVTNGKLDTSKTMQAACTITPAVNDLHKAICNSLSGKMKEDCLKAQDIIQVSSQILLDVAADVYGACTN